MNLHARGRLIPYYVISYAVRVLAQCLVKRKAANNEYLASKTKINNTGIFCCYFTTRFHSANLNFGLRPKLGGQISLWTERKDSAKE